MPTGRVAPKDFPTTHAQDRLVANFVMTTGLNDMKLPNQNNESGAMGYILAWLIGIPIPILLLIFLLRGCS